MRDLDAVGSGTKFNDGVMGFAVDSHLGMLRDRTIEDAAGTEWKSNRCVEHAF